MMCLNKNKIAWRSWGVLALRVVLGFAFLIHGLQKFSGLEQTAGFFNSIGIPLPSIMAPIVAGIETLGGIALIAGIFTCGASILLSIVMLVALFTVHAAKGFGAGGIEYPLVLIASLFAIYTGGPGEWALGGNCEKQCSGGSCGESTCGTGTTCKEHPTQPQQ